jgi:glutamate 5-kinase
LFKNIKRLVVKIGTSVISENEKLNNALFRSLSGQIGRLLKNKLEVVLVSSGAICAGMEVLNLKARPKDLPLLQATAAVGQNILMRMWEESFCIEGFKVAQILLTREDLIDRKRYLNARNTLNMLLRHRVVPIVNENDTVSVDEIKFGDNDYLSSLVANLVDADLLIVLSDVEGLYERDQDSKRSFKIIKEVKRITPYIEGLPCGTKKEVCVGGMSSKIEAAKIAVNSGIPMVLSSTGISDVLSRVVGGDDIGTLFLPKEKMVSRKRWIAYGSKISGQIIVDEGAKTALISSRKSLLASGILDCKGDFRTGGIVSITDVKKNEFARGLTNYSSEEIKKIKGLKSALIEQALGYRYYDEVIHRDNLVVF